jgi:hypothetical protein
VFLAIEDDGVILMDRVVSLVREDGKTKILMADNSALFSGFTPATLARRTAKFRRAGAGFDKKRA